MTAGGGLMSCVHRNWGNWSVVGMQVMIAAFTATVFNTTTRYVLP